MRSSITALTCALALSASLDARAVELQLVNPTESQKLVDDPESVGALAGTPHAIDARILQRLADRYAAALNRGPGRLSPLGRRVLRDLDGRPSAHVSTYARGQAETADQRLGGLDVRALSLASALSQDTGVPTPGEAKAFRAPDRYLTAILGATRAQKRLISLSDGLPPQAFEGVARSLVATKLGRDPATLSARAFAEPDLPRGRDLGVVVTAGAQRFVFLLPTPSLPHGRVVSEDAFRRDRDVILNARRAAEAERFGQAAPTTIAGKLDLAARVQGPKWDTLIAESRGGATSGPALRYSPLAAQPDFNGGILRPDLFDLFGDDDCTCTESFLDGTSQSVLSCDGFSDSCCDWVDGEFQDTGHCPNTCVCECEETAHVEGTTDYGVFIRGVPTMYQQQVTVPSSIFCEDQVAVGCGAIVAAELFAWYDGMGHTDLSDGFRNSGKIKWKTMAETLRNDYLGSHCWDDATWTLPGDLKTGIRNFITDQGEAYDSVDLTSYLDADEASAFSLVQAEVDAGRPIILGYDSDNAGGLGGTIDHYGLITGYVDDNIYVNTGWGYGDNEMYEFEIGGGWWIYLLTVNMDNIAGFGGSDAECAPDDLGALLYGTSDVGWSSDEPTYDSYPVIDDIGGVLCDLIGGEEPYSYDYTDHTTSTLRCLTPAEKERLDDSIEETMDELDGFSDPLDPIYP